MKKFITILIVMVMFCTSLAAAEEAFLDLVEDSLGSMTDLSDKDVFALDASGSDPSRPTVLFDFTDGNQTIVAIHGDRARVFATFEDDELMSVLFRMLTEFEDISSKLEDGLELRYEMKYSDTDKHTITNDTLRKYYAWLQQ